ncbi:unnamed protein product [Lepeophtheirus salmonis]|uniref:(salmon louse) hypothetical protein n=2 Tax=Lepeophtheirus salmonis TaxID=72036 RepID=A0A7R8D8U4_LEPSM|nr:unnamed protein product [Lepeophtheirus salmonis]CAF3013041.1 unnamed protein product [Lepeophtheirus salmonis]
MVGIPGLEALPNEVDLSPPNRARLIFNIIKFENDPCGTGSMVGTCYTSEECSSRGGTAGGSCASGYGTCCVFSLGCGGTTSENSTYLEVTSRTTDCAYTICRCSTNVCRIRLDFLNFVINGPEMADDNPNSYGNCNTDSFTVSGNQGGSPVICGFNTGQHMIVEAQDTCNTAFFNIGDNTAGVTRTWSINVTQYECGDEFGGPPGCLQYLTSTSGFVQSFNYNTRTTAVHLADQDYNVCFRRAPGNCRICYATVNEGVDIETFGLSISTDAAQAKSGTNTDCSTDFIEIPAGVRETDLTLATLPANTVFRNCGRFLNTKRNLKATTTVCSFSLPFRFRFVTDTTEALAAGGANVKETKLDPSGVIGYKMFYKQMAC